MADNDNAGRLPSRGHVTRGGRGGRGRGGRGRGRGRGGNNNRDANIAGDVSNTPSDSLANKPEKIKNGITASNDLSKNKKKSDPNHRNKGSKKDEKKSQYNNGGNDSNEKKSEGIKQSNKNVKKSGNKNDNKEKKLSTENATFLPNTPSIPPNQPQQTSDINYGKGTTITVLHIAEKPSIGEAIAKGLSSGPINKKTRSLPVHEFTDPPFPNAPFAATCKHRVTSVAGHVFSVDFPQKFQSWESVDPLELFDAPVVRKPCQGSVVKHLVNEAKGVDFIVLWMDCDREGENINFEVLDCCMNEMKDVSGSQFDRVYRAYFSAINPSDIKKAYQSLGKPDKNQALSVDARQELDLKVGVAFSRFQTRFFQGRYGDLDSAVLSYGPCQTPTLGFCVQRHIDVETFKPEPYWTLELGIIKRGRALRALWDSGRSFNKTKVEALVLKGIEESGMAKVANVTTQEKKQGRPIPLNTVGLLKACSKALGIGPHSAMQTAERLYLSGYMSYPRTESTAYPQSFDITGTLRQQSTDSRWASYVRNLLVEGVNKSRGGVDMGDHPPITPCRPAREGELSGDMARVYELVVRHFIASVSKDAIWRSTRVDFRVESLGEKGSFTLRGKELMSPGFLAVLLHKGYGDDAVQDDGEEEEEERLIPEFTKGEQLPLINSKGSSSSGSKVQVAVGESVHASLEIKEKKTTPPGYLTESELIGLMEKNGIGTDASIPTHIQNIQNRNYVSLESGRRLLPTKLGLVLVQGYHQIDSSLVLPRVRSDIEGECNRIAKGLAGREEVVRKAIQWFREKFQLFVEKIDRMDVLFASSFSKIEDMGKPFTRCGHSRRYLQYIPGPPPRLYNKWTESVYPLPNGGIVKQWTGRNCPVAGCDFELCLYSTGQPQRTFPLCPRCFNDPEWALDIADLPDDEDDRDDERKERQILKVAGKTLILECPLPDYHPLIEEMTIAPDPDGDGVLILDPHLGPKWRLVSTRNPTIVHLPHQNIDRITILDKKDDELGVHMIQVEFKSGQSLLPDGVNKYMCCFSTDKVLQDKIRVYRGSERLKAPARGGRGRGGARSGRGRRGGRR